jgi:hypothetical protein
MLSRFFHNWERRLASVSKDRVVRPFEWGEEWIHLAGPEGPAFPASPAQPALHRWVDDVMRDTSAFFDTPATNDYDFDARTGELRFPSALTTPHPANNTVLARWFPASASLPPSRSRFGGTRRRGKPANEGKRAVVVLPQWNSDAGGHIGLSRLLARFGVSALRLSLPYHDARMPPELTRADYIVSANVARTIQVCRQAVLDARRAVAWLALQGYERIGILGTSLGSCLALLTSAHEPRIRAQALNHVSPWFADVVWRGLSTRHVRESLDGNVTLDELRELWRPINPWSYLDRIHHAKTLLVYARYDLTFPVDLSRVLIDEFARRGLPHEVAVLPCGHYSTGVAPFSYMDAYVLVNFLRRNL